MIPGLIPSQRGPYLPMLIKNYVRECERWQKLSLSKPPSIQVLCQQIKGGGWGVQSYGKHAECSLIYITINIIINHIIS